LKVGEYLVGPTGGVDGDKAVGIAHGVESFDEACLVFDEAVVHVLGEAEVHAAFPEIELAAADDDAGDEVRDAGAEVVDDEKM
jgi:hypothetical protein